MAEKSYPLPVGIKQFEEFSERIIKKSGAFADRDSMLFAIASILIHADASKGSLPDSYFIGRLRKSAANQVASQVFQEVKQRQAEKAKQEAEVTALEAVANEQTQEV